MYPPHTHTHTHAMTEHNVKGTKLTESSLAKTHPLHDTHTPPPRTNNAVFLQPCDGCRYSGSLEMRNYREVEFLKQ